MSVLAILLTAVFLPLFPFSLIYNRLFARLGNSWQRIALVLAWPQIGIAVAGLLAEPLPQWIVHWAVATSVLYAFRSLVIRELGLWTAFMSTSAWALVWPLALLSGSDLSAWEQSLALQTLGLSVPFVLLSVITGRLQGLFGAAYAGAIGGLASAMPRLSVILVLSILAAVASPVFPGFFSLLGLLMDAAPQLPLLAVCVTLVWLLWAWSGARVSQGFTVGPPSEEPSPDLDGGALLLATVTIAVLASAGLVYSEYLL